MTAEETAGAATHKTMKAITPSCHQKNIERFQKLQSRLDGTTVCEKFSGELQELDDFYYEYLRQLAELRKLLDKYHVKTEGIRELCRRRKKRK